MSITIKSSELHKLLLVTDEERQNGIFLDYGNGKKEYKYSNGQLREHCFYENDERHGEYKLWHHNGQLRKHCFYENGKLHGEYKSWYDNGQPCVHCFYENDKRHGEYKTWRDNGQLRKHCFYKNGRLLIFKTFFMELKKYLNKFSQ